MKFLKEIGLVVLLPYLCPVSGNYFKTGVLSFHKCIDQTSVWGKGIYILHPDIFVEPGAPAELYGVKK